MDKTSRRMDGKGFFSRYPNKLGSPKALRNVERLRVRGRTFWWSARKNAWAKPYPYRTRTYHYGTIYRELPDGSLVAWKYVSGDQRAITRIIEATLAAPSKTQGVLP